MELRAPRIAIGEDLPSQLHIPDNCTFKEYEDISAPMRELVACDRYLKQRFADQFKWAESLEGSA